jgi:hypothetical protein
MVEAAARTAAPLPQPTSSSQSSGPGSGAPSPSSWELLQPARHLIVLVLT